MWSAGRAGNHAFAGTAINLLASPSTCQALVTSLCRSRANKQQLQQEIERLKGSDALTQAVGEFARVSAAVRG